jgi:O-antigen ligase/tetratricopeptide (TPR) repeat protein
VSGVLIFSFILWLVWSLCSKKFVDRRTGLEIGLCVFLVAAVIAGFAAADKRLAITDSTVLVAPLLMTILLIQILDSGTKIRLILAVIVALAVVNAQQSAEQFFRGNQMAIEQYEQDPRSMLEPLGIEPNTFQQFMFEHRIYSGGVRGYFTTRNSAGSFLLLASFAAAAIFIDRLRNRKSGSGDLHILACGVAAAVVLFSLALTLSKGAFIGLFCAAIVFAAQLRFGSRLKAHRKVLFAACALLGVATVLVVASYGLNHGRLPGGSSMLVRWQYWRAAARMYADHWLTGVGPGNFSDYYTRYKPDAALESVADPHNFPLSILTQYGPLGLVGFLAIIVMPFWMVLSPSGPGPSAPRRGALPKTPASRPARPDYGGPARPNYGGQAFYKPAIGLAVCISAALLIVRPVIFPMPPTGSSEERQAGILVLYIMPVFVFLVGFLLVAAGLGQLKKSGPGPTASSVQRGAYRKKPDAKRYPLNADSVIAPALFSAAIGLLIHNLIDFAIFEPGVLTTFWAIIACLIATDYNENSRPCSVLRAVPVVRLAALVAGLAIVLAYLNYALIPVAASAEAAYRAQQIMSFDQFDQIHTLLDSAATDDPLDPAALSLNGRLYLRHFELTHNASPGVPGEANRDLLVRAEKCFLGAIDRNAAAFKNFERLTDVYMLLAETAPPQDSTSWLNKAFDTASQAVECYPGCARLRVEMARIAEQLGKTDIAVEQYKKAIDIEDSYARQFKAIYPQKEEAVSRLGNDKYLYAKERLKALCEEKTP